MPEAAPLMSQGSPGRSLPAISGSHGTVLGSPFQQVHLMVQCSNFLPGWSCSLHELEWSGASALASHLGKGYQWQPNGRWHNHVPSTQQSPHGQTPIVGCTGAVGPTRFPPRVFI